MTLLATVSIVVAVIDALVAIVTARISKGPGWRELAPFAASAAFASIFAMTDVVFTLPALSSASPIASRIGLLAAGLHGSAWFAYVAAQESRRASRFERFMIASGFVIGVPALIPGVFVSDVVYARPVPWLGVVYHDAYPTILGKACYGFFCFGLLSLITIFVKKWRRCVPGALGHALGLAALLGAAVNDSLAASRTYDGPYLLDIGYLTCVMCVGVILTSRFIESARSLEEQTVRLRETQAELVERERLAAVGELSAVVAHEVRTPVSIMFNALSMLRKKVASEETAGLVGIVEEEAHRLKRTIDDLLAFARPQSLRIAPVELRPLVTNAADAARTAQSSSSTIEVEVADALTLDCDEHLLREAIVNLVTNALQASPEASPVHVEASRVDGHVRIEVTDRGAGVSADVRPRLFTPFFTTRASGTGLGLAIVKRVAEAHGGEAFVEPREGPGATFVLRLPAKPPT